MKSTLIFILIALVSTNYLVGYNMALVWLKKYLPAKGELNTWQMMIFIFSPMYVSITLAWLITTLLVVFRGYDNVHPLCIEAGVIILIHLMPLSHYLKKNQPA